MKRIGRWIDFRNDYKTLDPTYMESVWWVFQAALGQRPGVQGVQGAARLYGNCQHAICPAQLADEGGAIMIIVVLCCPCMCASPFEADCPRLKLPQSRVMLERVDSCVM